MNANQKSMSLTAIVPFLLAFLGAASGRAEEAPEGTDTGIPDSSLIETPTASDPGWRAANEAMMTGSYEEAASQYRHLLDQEGDSAELHFNLGLAHAHLDRLPRSVYHLMQAHFLAPGDADIRDSLELVRAELQQRQSRPAVGDTLTKGDPPALFWLSFFHRIGRLGSELLLIGASWLAFLLVLLRRRMRPSGFRDTVLVLVVLSFVALAGALAYRLGAGLTADSVRPAVVVVDRPVVRRGPDAQAGRLASADIDGGSVVLIAGERESWVEIELEDGEIGWLPRQQVLAIRVGDRSQ